jgi:hypothetical protein
VAQTSSGGGECNVVAGSALPPGLGPRVRCGPLVLFAVNIYLAWARADSDARRYANVVARLPVPNWDTPVTAPVNPQGKQTLLFVLRASSYTWSGINRIYLKAEGLRQGKVAATVDCQARYFKDRSRSNIVGAQSQHDACNMSFARGAGCGARHAASRQTRQPARFRGPGNRRRAGVTAN